MLPTSAHSLITTHPYKGVYAVPVAGALGVYIPEPCTRTVRLTTRANLRLPNDLQKRLLHDASKLSKRQSLGEPLIALSAQYMEDLSPWYQACRVAMPALTIELKVRSKYRSDYEAWKRTQRRQQAHDAKTLDAGWKDLEKMGFRHSNEEIVPDSEPDSELSSEEAIARAELLARNPQRSRRTGDLRVTMPPAKPPVREPRGSNRNIAYLSTFETALIRNTARWLRLPVSTLVIAARWGVDVALQPQHLDLARRNRAITQAINLQYDGITAIPALTGADGSHLRCDQCGFLMGDH